jgi:hypothetical protein
MTPTRLTRPSQSPRAIELRAEAAETAEANRAYLTAHTTYLTKRQLREQFGRFYTDVRFVEDAFLENSARQADPSALALAAVPAESLQRGR